MVGIFSFLFKRRIFIILSGKFCVHDEAINIGQSHFPIETTDSVAVSGEFMRTADGDCAHSVVLRAFLVV